MSTTPPLEHDWVASPPPPPDPFPEGAFLIFHLGCRCRRCGIFAPVSPGLGCLVPGTFDPVCPGTPG